MSPKKSGIKHEKLHAKDGHATLSSKISKNDDSESISKIFKGEQKLSFEKKLYLLIAFLVLVVILLLIFQFQKMSQEKPKEQIEIAEESKGSGFLAVETLPSDADVFMDNVYGGKSPLTLSNVPAGSHKIVIKKDSYESFISEINIEAGRKTFLEADLVLIPTVEEKIKTAEVTEEKEEIEIGTLKANGMVNVGEKFVLYYDFGEGKTTDIRQLDSDVFSKRFSSYLVFTRFDPVSIKTIDKSIDNVKREDCVGIKGQLEYLHSGQSLCVITKENEIVVLGGTWDSTENAKLTWKMFS